MEKRLLIFVKNEELGEAKTRLAASLGPKKALEIYQKLLAYTAQQTIGVADIKKEVWYARYIAEKDVWQTGDFNKKVQRGEGLGERMLYAFEQAYKENPKQKVLIIGSDCAELTADIIRQAYTKLDDAEVVIGPAKDGGYYLLGMRQLCPQLFENIRWSSAQVFNQTLKRVQEMEASYAVLQELNDVDTLEDWKQVAHMFM
jgi:rSAM/selenodomain-associated transferase 1